ncbi:MAG: LPS assembly protein LptD [Gammaproteobacteria bacterium]|nr:LPS assembly protein LptD [Gammaproteobacteria bacterium]MBT8132997.1 LPS assembly protein LptD [Gammaproteobacteria bacterium]NNJ48790.1 LPS assembly protein LptD [Gammaproteobacteria bacterium]
MFENISRSVCLSLLIITSQNVSADNAELQSSQVTLPDLSLCPEKYETAITRIAPREFPVEERDNTEISADFTETSRDGSTTLDGNIVIERHLLRVTADHAKYNRQDDEITLSGNIYIDTENMSLNAESGTVSTNGEDEDSGTQGRFNDIVFFIAESNMNGKAEAINSGEHGDGVKRSTLINASITSCNLSKPDWLISADEIELDHDDEYGSAEDVVIRFKDIPFMYVPYMEFPTSDKRRSGFLFPQVGTSSSRGLELNVPWYWNIAENHDAVITPSYMEKRGLELGGKYRYLTRSTNGELQGVYLPDDDITMEDRYQFRYVQRSQITPNLSFGTDLHDISDSDYFNDFSNSLGTTSLTHLDRNATLRYNLSGWQMKAMIQDIKTIDENAPLATRPYERLPQITLAGDEKVANSPLLFTLDSEYVDFTHEDDTKTTGSRLTVRPGLSLPLSGTAWFFEPAVKFSHTQYDVGTESGTTQPVDDRSLPISSIDTGLFFERFLSNGYQQTLEPRLYYLNVPFEDQDNIPLFDTSIPSFSVAQLFRDNRFVGGDRIGDTNQLTAALTSRILNPNTGDEFVRASIGQIYYFEDRKVSLTGGSIDTERQSDVIAELDIKWRRWQSNIDLQWDVSRNQLSQENYFLHFKSDDRHLFNIGYRKRLFDDSGLVDIEQTDTSFVYAINRNYSAIARWNYSLKDIQDIDTIFGVAYDSCCWSIQLLSQRLLRNSTTSNEYDTAILVQFVFKGLGSLSGSRAQQTLEESIYGYRDIYR